MMTVYQNFINGSFVDGSSTIEIHNPATGEVSYFSMTSGNFVTCIKVEAFKCGQLVAEIYREIQVILGHVTPDRAYHYAMRQDDSRVYLVDATWGMVLARLAEEPPYPEWYYQVSLDRMLYIGVVHEGTEIEFTKDPRGWRYAAGGNEYVDQNRWEQVLPYLGGPEDLSILQNTIDDFAKYGLLDPSTIVYAEFSPPTNVQESRRRVVVEIGDPEPSGGGFYAKIQGQPYLLSVNQDWRNSMIELILDPPQVSEAPAS